MILLMLQVGLCSLVLGDLVLNKEKLKTVTWLATDLLKLFKDPEQVQNPVPALISTLVLADAIFMLFLVITFKRVSACKLMGLAFVMLFLSSCITVIVFYDKPTEILVQLLVDADDLTSQKDPDTSEGKTKGQFLCDSIVQYTAVKDDSSVDDWPKCLGTDGMCKGTDDANVYTFEKPTTAAESKEFEDLVDECLAQLLKSAKMYGIEEQIVFAACLVLSFAIFSLIFVHMIVLQNSSTLSSGLA